MAGPIALVFLDGADRRAAAVAVLLDSRTRDVQQSLNDEGIVGAVRPFSTDGRRQSSHSRCSRRRHILPFAVLNTRAPRQMPRACGILAQMKTIVQFDSNR